MTGSPSSPSVPLEFIYHELWTSDPEARLPFYRDLFGWTIVSEPRSDGEFLRIHHGDSELARIVPMERDDSPDRWNVVLAFPDLDALRTRVEGAQGQVLIREQQLPGLGRAALLMDSLNGVFAAVERGSGTLPRPRSAGPGTFSWHDLLTPNLERSSRFYQSCWGIVPRSSSADTAHVHRLFRSEGTDIAGLLATHDEEHPALWLPYIAVDDVVEKVEQAADAGAEVWLEPTEVAELGTFAILSDPGRALFAVRTDPA